MKRLLNTKDICLAYNLSRSSLWRRLKANQIPAPTVINGRNYWLADHINDHIESVMGGVSQ